MMTDYAIRETTVHKVIRVSDGACLGNIEADWGDYILLHMFPDDSVPTDACELFRWDMTPEALDATCKYRFEPPVN